MARKRKSGGPSKGGKTTKLSVEEITDLVNNDSQNLGSEVLIVDETELEEMEVNLSHETVVSVPSSPPKVPESLHADPLSSHNSSKVEPPVPSLLLVGADSNALDEEKDEITADADFQAEDVVAIELSDSEHEAEVADPLKRFGRPRTSAWDNYIVTTDGRKRKCFCKTCGKSVSAKADRLAKHTTECDLKRILRERATRMFGTSVSAPDYSVSVPETPSGANNHQTPANLASSDQPKMDGFLDHVTKAEKAELDKLCAEFIYKKNLPFTTVEDPSFIAFLKRLRPAYNPPSRHDVAGKLLDAAYDDKKAEMRSKVGGKKVTIMQDGWSTNQNDPVLVHALSDGHKTVFLNAIPTEDNVKTAEYCREELKKAITSAENEYGVTVIGCVTDNCNSMNKLRELVSEEMPDLLVFGCNTHLFNLIGQDLSDDDLMCQVVKVQKYFRLHHFESARLKLLRGNRPVLPSNTRWNGQIEVFENYVKNQAIYLQIIRDEKSGLFEKEGEINKILSDGNFYTRVVETVAKLEPISRKLDSLQRDNARYATAIHYWFELKTCLNFSSKREKMRFKKRFKMAVTDLGLATYMLHPEYKGKLLYGKYIERGRAWLAKKNPYYVVIFMNLQAGNTQYFPETLLSPEVIKKSDPEAWWSSVASSSNMIVPGFQTLVESLMLLPASTSGLERSLSTMGSIMTQERNRLEIKKAEKLCFVNFHSKSPKPPNYLTRVSANSVCVSAV